MIATNCEEKIKSIIAEKLGIEAETLSNQTHFTDDLAVDSLDLVEVIWEMEKEFKVSIPDEDIEKMTTVGDLVHYIEERVN